MRLPLAPRCQVGFTLVEMLVVISIAVLLGTMMVVSMAAVGRRSARAGAAQSVASILQQARLSAVDSGLGAVVRIDPQERALYGLSRKVEAAWHFEEVVGGVTPGARQMDGTLIGSPSARTGAVGLCLEFGAADSVDCGDWPVFNATDGLRLEAYVAPTDAGTILAKAGGGAGYRLFLWAPPAGGDFDLRAEFETEAGQVALDSSSLRPGLVRTAAWTHVAAEYDGFQGRLYVNGVLADSKAPGTVPARLRPARGVALTVAGGGFQGRIDEPQVLSVAGGQRVALPAGVRLRATEEAIYFDAEGNLDLAHHSAPAFIGLADPYQAASLAADITATDVTLTVTPRNPFPPSGGHLMVGDDASGYEIIQFSSASGMNVTGLTRGACRTTATAHTAGQNVFYARIVRIGQTGQVERLE